MNVAQVEAESSPRGGVISKNTALSLGLVLTLLGGARGYFVLEERVSQHAMAITEIRAEVKSEKTERTNLEKQIIELGSDVKHLREDVRDLPARIAEALRANGKKR